MDTAWLLSPLIINRLGAYLTKEEKNDKRLFTSRFSGVFSQKR